MSNNCVFDPRLNVVAVDPDSKEVIQIPGTEFQAEVTSDSYERIALYPNYYTGKNSYGGHASDMPPTPGEYALGVAMESRNRYGVAWAQGIKSLMFRISNAHIIEASSRDMYAYQVQPEYDKYIDYTDFVNYTSDSVYNNASHEDRGFVRFKWQEMKGDGKSLPSILTSFLSFNVEIYRGLDQEPVVMEESHTGPLPIQDGPFSPPIIIPVRVSIPELWNA